MNLLDSLIVGVGMDISKGIAKLWLKDIPRVNLRDATLLEILQTKITNPLAARNVSRQLEQIADGIAGNILESVDTIRQHLTFQQKLAVSHDVGQTVITTVAEDDFSPGWLDQNS